MVGSPGRIAAGKGLQGWKDRPPSGLARFALDAPSSQKHIEAAIKNSELRHTLVLAGSWPFPQAGMPGDPLCHRNASDALARCFGRAAEMSKFHMPICRVMVVRQLQTLKEASHLSNFYQLDSLSGKPHKISCSRYAFQAA